MVCLESMPRRVAAPRLWAVFCLPPWAGAATGTFVGLACASVTLPPAFTNTRPLSARPGALRCLCASVVERCRDLGGNLIKEIAEGAFQGLTLAAYNSGYDVTL